MGAIQNNITLKDLKRSEEILKRMYEYNCGVTLKRKEESLEFLIERYKELKLEGKQKSKEGKMIFDIINASKTS